MDANDQMALALAAGVGSIAKPPVAYPSADDVAFARKNDATYGDPSAGFLTGKGNVPQMDIQTIPFLLRGGSGIGAGASRAPVDKETSDNLYKGWLASKQSAVAGLGFDPHNMVVSPPSTTQLNVGGLYTPGSDNMWFDQQRYPEAAVHESMHRGIQQLRDAGTLPPGIDHSREELLVRALMQRNFGDLERNRKYSAKDQIDASKPLMSDPDIFTIENAAADLYAKRKPGGPR
jgi:hypothetical protein